jgi:hypothetical protein
MRDTQQLIHSHLKIGHPHNDILELAMFPSVGGSLHDSERSIVLGTGMRFRTKDSDKITHEFVVLDVKEDKFRP